MVKKRRPPRDGRHFLDKGKADGFNDQEYNPLSSTFQDSRFAADITRDAFGNARAWHPDEWGGFVDRKPARRSVRQAPKTWHLIGDVLADILHDVGGEKDEAA